MLSKIVHKLPIKIYLLIIISCCGTFSSNVDTSKTVQQCLDKNIQNVPFRRIQTYRSVVLNASGRADFNNNEKIIVTYIRPFKNSVSYSDSVTTSICKGKKTYTNSGFGDASVYDPFQALMLLCSIGKKNLIYIGAFDSIWIYEGDMYRKKFRFLIERETNMVREISCINAYGGVYERMLFNYKKDHQMPSSVVVLKSTGGELVKDSLTFDF